MKLYGHFLSAPANQARLSASAMAIDHDYVHVDLMNGEQREEPFRLISLFGKVPALQDGDFNLCESGAIVRYLAAKSESALYPQELLSRARVDQWMDYASMHVRASMSKVLFNMLFAPMMGIEIDKKSLAEGREQLSDQLPHIECALAGNQYLTGDTLTVADVAMIASMEPFEKINVSLNDFPNTNKWRQSVMAEDWYTRIHTHYGAEME